MPDVEVLVNIPETEPEAEAVVIPAPIIVAPDNSVDQAELISLREFKQEVEQARLDEIEDLALEATLVANAALEATVIAEEVELIPEPEIDIAPIEQEPDTSPTNSPGWFKTWFNK